MDISTYLLVKTLHVTCLIFWLGSMLALPLIMAQHSLSKNQSSETTLITLEHQLLRFLINPSMILAFLFGIWLIFITGAGAPESGKWFHIKALFIISLALNHTFLARKRRQLKQGTCTTSARCFIKLSLLTTLLTLAASYLAIVKPL